MAIANGTCVSFCTFWPPPGYAPGTITVNVTWMERGFNASNAPQYVPIYLQPFPSNSTRKFKSSYFSTFFSHILALPMGTRTLGQSRYMLQEWKEDSMLVKRVAARRPTHLSSTVYEL